MPPTPVSTDRIRAWIFAVVADPNAFQMTLLQDLPYPSKWVGKKFYEIGGDDFVIVRADEVETLTVGDQNYNFVFPVDASDDVAFAQAVKIITDELNIKYTMVVKVIEHNPWPPHRAHGFITETEFGYLPDDKIGRQSHKSPGSNKWG